MFTRRLRRQPTTCPCGNLVQPRRGGASGTFSDYGSHLCPQPAPAYCLQTISLKDVLLVSIDSFESTLYNKTKISGSRHPNLPQISPQTLKSVDSVRVPAPRPAVLIALVDTWCYPRLNYEIKYVKVGTNFVFLNPLCVMSTIVSRERLWNFVLRVRYGVHKS